MADQLSEAKPSSKEVNMTTMGMPTELYGWGSPSKEYTTNRWYKYLFIAGAILFGLFLLIALMSVIDGNNDWGAVGVTGAFVLLFVVAYFRVQQSVAVHDQGFVYRHGKKVRVIEWDEIETVKQFSMRIRLMLFIVIKSQGIWVWTKDGKKVKLLDQIGNVGELIETIQAEVTGRKLPEVIVTFARGDEVVFDKNIKVSKQGITWGRKTLAWDEFEEIKVFNGMLTVRKKGKRWGGFASTQIGAMPNLFVFVGLVERVAKERLWV